MSIWIDKKYISLISSRLDRYVQKSEFLYNCRCPYCMDSRKSKTKARGYIYRQKNDMFYMCHNCGMSVSFGKLLKMLDPLLYQDYNLERYRDDGKANVPLQQPNYDEFRETPKFDHSEKIDLPKCSELSPTDAPNLFLKKRCIPLDKTEFYYAEDFISFVRKYKPEYAKGYDNIKDPRLIIPFYDQEHILIGFQGRALLPNQVKYVTILFPDTNSPKVFGMDRLDLNKSIYVLEGPFDSLFLDNAIATMDSTLYKIRFVLGNTHDYTLVYDNEPRNRDIVHNMEQSIKLGYKVCIWPDHIVGKDINDFILGGYNKSQIQSIIDNNTFSDLKAKMALDRWKKIKETT